MSGLPNLSIEGRVATRADLDWDNARAAWNLACDQQPEAVAFVESAKDVASVVRYAGERGLMVTAQGTGHGAAALGPLQDTILIKTELMRGVEVNAATRTARVEAGALSLALGDAAQSHGLCALPGSAEDVGVVGYTLGGGLGWLGRKHGFACNHVVAIELVTAAGEPMRVDAEADPQLFWALRGGGGSFAIVTALHIALLPIAEVYAGALILPAELGASAIKAYRDWAASAPEEVTSIVRFLRLPPLPEIPQPLRDKPLLTIGAACIGSQADGERLIAPLREIGEPILDTFAQIQTSKLTGIHMDPDHPVPACGHHGVLRELPDTAIDAFVSASGPDSDSPLLLAELRHAGGALARAPHGAGALDKLTGDFVMFAVGVPATEQLREAIGARLDLIDEAMQPWANAGGYLNFAERPCDTDAILPVETCTRLREVKRTWDPEGVIRSAHELSLA